MAEYTLKFNDEEPAQPTASQFQATSAPPWLSALQGIGDVLPAALYGGEKAVGNIAQAGASMTGFQPLQDLSTAIDKDADSKVPNLQDRPVRQFNWNVASGIPMLGASMLTTLATDNPVLGAAVQSPDILGGTIKDVKSRGGSDDQAMKAGLENAALSTAIMSIPMHQFTEGGPLLTRVLKNTAVNAAAGASLSFGNEEIEKANDVRALPDGQEFNNAVYSSLVGGVTGGILGVTTPAEKAINADKVADIVLDQKMREGILTTQQAQMARQELIKNIQDLAVRTRFKGGNTTEKIESMVNAPNKAEEEIKNGTVYVYDQGDGGTTRTVDNILPSATSDEWHQATRIVNQAFTTAERDESGKILRDKDGVPKVASTETDKMPIEYQHVLYNDILSALRAGGQPLDVLDDVMNKRLPSQQHNVIIDLGGHAGERSPTENVFSPVAGVQTIRELAAASQSAGVDPSTVKIYHANEPQAARDLYSSFIQEVGQHKASTEAIQGMIPPPPEAPQAPLPPPEDSMAALYEHPSQAPQQEAPAQNPEPPPIHQEAPLAPFEPIDAEEHTTALKDQLDRIREIQRLKEEATIVSKDYDQLPEDPQTGMADEAIEEAVGDDHDTDSIGDSEPGINEEPADYSVHDDLSAMDSIGAEKDQGQSPTTLTGELLKNYVDVLKDMRTLIEGSDYGKAGTRGLPSTYIGKAGGVDLSAIDHNTGKPVAETINEFYAQQLQEIRNKLDDEGLLDGLKKHYGKEFFEDPKSLEHAKSIIESFQQSKQTPRDEINYKKSVISDVREGKLVREIEFTHADAYLSGLDIKTGEEVMVDNNDGKFKLTMHEDGNIELEGANKHIMVSPKEWAGLISDQREDIENGDPAWFSLKEYIPMAKDIAAAPPQDQKDIYDAMASRIAGDMENTTFWHSIIHGDMEKADKEIAAVHPELTPEERAKMASGFVDLTKNMPKVVSADLAQKLSTGLGEKTDLHELEADIDPSNIRSFPAKIGFKLAAIMGTKDRFIAAMEQWYGKAKFEDVFKTGKPAPVDHQIIQGLMEDKRLVDLVNFMATDNLRPAMKVLWQAAAEKSGPDAKRSDIQKTYQFLDSLMSRASEEIRTVEGDPKKYSKSFIGMGLKEFSRSGQPGTRDEWRDRDNFIKDYSSFLKTMNKPMPPTMEGHPELAFFNLLKEAGGDRVINLMLWTKAELEHASFSEMLKAGVFNNSGISANMFHGYSPRSWDYKGVQKDHASSRNPGGSPIDKSAGVPERDALNYSDFVGRARDMQGLSVNEGYLNSMHEYISTSLMKAQQYRTLNWLRTFNIPDMKLKINGFESDAKANEIVQRLKYVEYKNSDNIRALATHTGLRENDILQQLGYIQDKNREGLVSWNKFSFETPYLQGSLSDVLDNIYPNSQSNAMRGFTQVMNVPKRILTISPFQHTLLFASSIMANSGYRLPLVLGKYLGKGLQVMANAPFALAAASKGEAQTHDIFGHPIEQDYRGMENLPMFIKDGFGTGWSSLAPGLFEDSKVAKYFIPEMMTKEQVVGQSWDSVLNMNRIMFDQFLTRELYAVTNARFQQFREMTGPDGQRAMTDAEASRRAVTLVNSTSGVVHQASFGKSGPLWSLLTFARGLTIAPLRVISGTIEPTLRNIYGQDSSKRYKVDAFSGALNPVTMGDVSPKDADFLQAYYAQHIVKTIGLRMLAMGTVQYALSFLDDDKKDEYGQSGSDPMNSKRFIWNNPEGSRLSIRTPWNDINGRRIMMDPTFLRESKVLLDNMGIGTRYQFPATTVSWMASRMNAWMGLTLGAINGVDPTTGVKFADKDTDEYAHNVEQWMMSKVMPLSLGWTQSEKEMRTENPAGQAIIQGSALFGSTPKTAPIGWTPQYEQMMKADKEFKTQQQKEKDLVSQMSADDVLRKKLSVYFTDKAKEEAVARKRNPQMWVKKTMEKAAQKYNVFGKTDDEGNVAPRGPSEDDQRQQQMAAQLLGGE